MVDARCIFSVTFSVQAQCDITINNMLHSDRLWKRPSETLCGGRCVLQARDMPQCRHQGVQGFEACLHLRC